MISMSHVRRVSGTLRNVGEDSFAEVVGSLCSSYLLPDYSHIDMEPIRWSIENVVKWVLLKFIF